MVKYPQVTIAALFCLAAIEIVALLNGINGTLLTIVVGIIAAIAGVAYPTPKALQN